MQVGVLGTGVVGETLATKLAALGHAVMMGSRTRNNAKANAWAMATGKRARSGNFADTASFGKIVIFATRGSALLDVAKTAGAANLADKVVIDVTDPVEGTPPRRIPDLSGTTSAGEELQRAVPGAKVVKTLNTLHYQLMVDPSRVPGQHDVFLCGDHADANAVVVDLLRSFGWKSPIDLGPLSSARATEGLLPFWQCLSDALGTSDFNYRIMSAQRADEG